MTIKRTVNGVEMEFELTGRELYNAYTEQQHEFDIQDIDAIFCCYEDNECVQEYGFSRTEIEAMYEDMAYRIGDTLTNMIAIGTMQEMKQSTM